MRDLGADSAWHDLRKAKAPLKHHHNGPQPNRVVDGARLFSALHADVLLNVPTADAKVSAMRRARVTTQFSRIASQSDIKPVQLLAETVELWVCNDYIFHYVAELRHALRLHHTLQETLQKQQRSVRAIENETDDLIETLAELDTSTNQVAAIAAQDEVVSAAFPPELGVTPAQSG
eukprot:TRINITY_DN38065_c0_g1_i1.p2 TRINITY_DN38065_c0_g1~~TRINITY_DN38065_c0_g1_i1.p2  ORF type:complete len:176 (+),score=41.97 TRINITY_DN38065_c0_g1_i1:3-530(+)